MRILVPAKAPRTSVDAGVMASGNYSTSL